MQTTPSDDIEPSRKPRDWSEMKHEPSKRTHVQNLIRGMLEGDLKVPTDLVKPLINLGLGISCLADYF